MQLHDPIPLPSPQTKNTSKTPTTTNKTHKNDQKKHPQQTNPFWPTTTTGPPSCYDFCHSLSDYGWPLKEAHHHHRPWWLFRGWGNAGIFNKLPSGDFLFLQRFFFFCLKWAGVGRFFDCMFNYIYWCLVLLNFLKMLMFFYVVESIFSVTHDDAVHVTCLRWYLMSVCKHMIVDMSSIPLRNLNKYYSLSWLAACLWVTSCHGNVSIRSLEAPHSEHVEQQTSGSNGFMVGSLTNFWLMNIISSFI